LLVGSGGPPGWRGHSRPPPRRRHKFITAPFSADKIPAATPFVIDPDRGFSLRREGERILLGIGRLHEESAFNTEVGWSLTALHVEGAVHRAPAVAEARLMRGWAGLSDDADQTGT
jgi:glycine/D-amino acid oxidase-like deaminating enzyme